MPEYEPAKLDPRSRAERFVLMQKEYSVLPPDDVNLPKDLYRNRRMRKTQELSQCGNESLNRFAELLEGTHISNFFKEQLIYEFGLGQISSWTSWGKAQEEFISHYLGISLEKNELGIFDPDPQTAFKIEANFYYNMSAALKYREDLGLGNPVSVSEWGQYIYKKLAGQLGS